MLHVYFIPYYYSALKGAYLVSWLHHHIIVYGLGYRTENALMRDDIFQIFCLFIHFFAVVHTFSPVVSVPYNIKHRFWRCLTMACNARDYWIFGLCATSGILKNTTFRKLDLFPSSDKMGDIYSVGSVRKSWPQSLDRLPLSHRPNGVCDTHPFTWLLKQIQFRKCCVL
jgi:hypothetical protein